MADVDSCRSSLAETSGKIVNELKSRGSFDTFRRECLADVDTRPAYQNLRQRVEGSVSSFLDKQSWLPNINRNQLREKLRRYLTDSRFLEVGVDRIVDQVVDRNIYTTYLPNINGLVKELLNIESQPSEERLDDDMEIADAGDADVVALVNPFGTWANQFHVPVSCDTNIDSSMSISSDSDNVKGGQGTSPAGLGQARDEDEDELLIPDVQAQMSPLSDECGRRWSSFIEPGSLSPASLSPPRQSTQCRQDGVDLSRLTSRLDPVIDRMIKTELDAAGEAETASCRQTSRQRLRRWSRQSPGTPSPPEQHRKSSHRRRDDQRSSSSRVRRIHSIPDGHAEFGHCMSPPSRSQHTPRRRLKSGDDARQPAVGRSSNNHVADARRRRFPMRDTHSRVESRRRRSGNRKSTSPFRRSNEYCKKSNVSRSNGGGHLPRSGSSRSRTQSRSGFAATPPRSASRVSPLMRSSPTTPPVTDAPKSSNSAPPPKCSSGRGQCTLFRPKSVDNVFLSGSRPPPLIVRDRRSAFGSDSLENSEELVSTNKSGFCVERLVSPRTPPFPDNGHLNKLDSVRIGPRTPPMPCSGSAEDIDDNSLFHKTLIPLSIPLPEKPIFDTALTSSIPLPSNDFPLHIPLPHSSPPEQSHPSRIPLPLAPAPPATSGSQPEIKNGESDQPATISLSQVSPMTRRSRERSPSRSVSILSSISASSSFSSTSKRHSSRSSLSSQAANYRSWSHSPVSSRSTSSRAFSRYDRRQGRQPARYRSQSLSPQPPFAGWSHRAPRRSPSPYSPPAYWSSAGSPRFDRPNIRLRQDQYERRCLSPDSGSESGLSRWGPSGGRRGEWWGRATNQWSAEERVPDGRWLERGSRSPDDWRPRRQLDWPLSPQRLSPSPFSPERGDSHEISGVGSRSCGSTYSRLRNSSPGASRPRRRRRRLLRDSRDDGEDSEHNDHRQRMQHNRRRRRDDPDDDEPRPSTTTFRGATRAGDSFGHAVVFGGGGDGNGGGSRRSSGVRPGYRADLAPPVCTRSPVVPVCHCNLSSVSAGVLWSNYEHWFYFRMICVLIRLLESAGLHLLTVLLHWSRLNSVNILDFNNILILSR